MMITVESECENETEKTEKKRKESPYFEELRSIKGSDKKMKLNT